MVDFTAQTRLHGYLYNAPETTTPVATFREQYRDNEPHAFKHPRTLPHDCRLESVKDRHDKKEWETWMFSHGLSTTYNSKNALYVKPKGDPSKKTPDKLLYEFGECGDGRAQFKYPRGIATDTEGDIVVADTGNHRVQRYNSAGIYKDEFGSKGEIRGEFMSPTDIATLDNDDVVVADSGNCRVQIFRPNGRLKYLFNTTAKPIYLATDNEFNVIVSTNKRTIEIYNMSRQQIGEFSLGPPASGRPVGLPVQVTESGEIVVCDTSCNKVKSYSYEGQLLTQFEPFASGEGLGLKPGSIALNPIGQIVVTDSLNHTANLYSDRGVLLQRLLSPADDLGAAHGCAVGPEGHLIVAEFTANGPHCVKIFRYGDCECHRSRGGTSRRNTPAPSPS